MQRVVVLIFLTLGLALVPGAATSGIDDCSLPGTKYRSGENYHCDVILVGMTPRVECHQPASVCLPAPEGATGCRLEYEATSPASWLGVLPWGQGVQVYGPTGVAYQPFKVIWEFEPGGEIPPFYQCEAPEFVDPLP